MAEARIALTIPLPAPDKRRLESLAAATAISESRLAQAAIRAYLDLQEWQIAEIGRGLADADRGDFASEEELAAFRAKWLNAG